MPQPNTTMDQVKFLGQWFETWSEMQREDFLPILVQAYHPKDHINGLIGSIDSLKVHGRRPSLFDCQVKLFHDWIANWSDSERSTLMEELRRIDPDFICQYDKEVSGESSSRDPTPQSEESHNPSSLVSSPPSTLPRSHSPHDSGLDEPISDGEPQSLDSHQDNDDSTSSQQANDSSSTSGRAATPQEQQNEGSTPIVNTEYLKPDVTSGKDPIVTEDVAEQ